MVSSSGEVYQNSVIDVEVKVGKNYLKYLFVSKNTKYLEGVFSILKYSKVIMT